ncbi:MAG: hypothetical protein KC613_17380 [Myxococcales bacterium]|nr:hypothetical protein [Myxococcales bacterium]
MKPSPQDLAALCRDLRAAGVPVDVRHELRLGEVFGRAGPVSGERARRLVQAVVLADPAHRADVEDALDGWLPTVADTTPPSAPVLEVAAVPGGAPPRREAPPGQRLPWDKVLGGLLAALALVGVVLLAIPHEDSPPPVVDPPPPVAQDLGVDGAVPTPTGSYAVPRVWTEPAQEVDWSPWFLFGIGLLGLLAVGPQARRWQVFPQALPPAGGEPPAPPPRPEVTPALASWTDPGDRRAMVWGVDHFETEDPSARLDLRGSIRATARAALRPVVRYRRRRQPRTVWLWVDGLADPQAHEVAQQVHADLRRANLDARLAWTFGSPERVTLADHDQTELPSDGLDTPPDGAIVVWFTDGHGLSHVDDDTERRRAVRALRAWPRLAIVQCGGAAQGGGDLKAHARSSGAVILTPDRVAGWIGRGVSPRKAGVDLTVWRAAAALSPVGRRPVQRGPRRSLRPRRPRHLCHGPLTIMTASWVR